MKASLATALLVGATLSSLLFSTAPAFAEAKGKVTICHATHSETNPFVEITINENALKAHFKDGHQEGEDTFGPCPAAVTPTPDVTTPGFPTPTTPAANPKPTKGVPAETNEPVPPHAEPNPGTLPTEQAYPAPSVTPNTVNGTVPASANPTPAPTSSVTPAATATDRLANTGANDWLYIWGAVGLLVLLAGIASVIYVRRKAV